MLGDLSHVSKINIICGRTDMRKSIDGLMTIIRDTYNMDPFANALYLFCGSYIRDLTAAGSNGRAPRQKCVPSPGSSTAGCWKVSRSNSPMPSRGPAGRRISERRFCAKRRNFIFFQKPEAFFIHI